MAIVMGLDQHRAQITAEWLDTATGEVSRGRIVPADRAGVRKFLGRFAGLELEVALEATTGWRFVVEELRRIGASVHLAEPAETSALRGNKQRAKNDRADARHLRELLMAGRLPECWIAPDHVLDLRAQVRLRHTLVDERGEWQQRMQAVLYHHGMPKRADLLNGENRAWLGQLALPAAAREQITVAFGMIDAIEARVAPLDQELRAYARRQPGCKALQAHYGIGALTSVAILAELGDTRRFSSSREAVRYAGMDITVHASDKRRAPGHLSRQGPPVLRWALYEAAQAADHRHLVLAPRQAHIRQQHMRSLTAPTPRSSWPQPPIPRPTPQHPPASMPPRAQRPATRRAHQQPADQLSLHQRPTAHRSQRGMATGPAGHHSH